MPSISIPAPLRPYVNGQKEIIVIGDSIQESMNDLVKKFPGVKPHIFDPDGNLRSFINIFLNEERVNESLEGLEKKLIAHDRLVIIASIAGGR